MYVVGVYAWFCISNQTKGRLKVLSTFRTAFYIYIYISVYFSNRAISSSAKPR